MGVNGLRTATLAVAVALIAPAWTLAAEAPGALSSTGGWLTDPHGRVVILHGFNMVAKGDPEQPSDRGFGTDDAKFLAREGFNVIRLGVDYAAIEPAPGHYAKGFIGGWARTAEMLARHRIYSLPDIHQDAFGEAVYGNGFPAWMADTQSVPNVNLGYPGSYAANPSVQRSFDNFWANDAAPDGTPLQDHFFRGLELMAKRFRTVPRLAGYDFFNEPWPGTPWPSCASPTGCPPAVGFDDALLTPFSRQAVSVLAAADPAHIPFYEPNLLFDFGADTRLGSLGDAPGAMSFHNYCLGAAPGLPVVPDPVNVCGVNENVVIDNAERHAAINGDALLMTEFGATDSPQIAARVAGEADQAMIGWNFWAYANLAPNNFQIPSQNIITNLHKPPRPSNINHALLDALVRPYPQAVAGTPISYGYDAAAGRFDLVYSTAAPSGRTLTGRGAPLTDIYLPRSLFPAYDVDLTGGRQVSSPDPQHLLVRGVPGAAQVSVSVTPSG